MTDAIMAGAGVADIALPSFDDEASYFKDVDPQATSARYAAAGVTTIIVKNGDGPVLFSKGDEAGSVSVTPVSELVDSTAAGDSFNAGVLAGFGQEISLEDSIAYGCRLAQAVVQERGALVDVPLSILMDTD